jgi:2-oxoisovalerate dehydrogenase E2 component (dihydrolipoyl transacylase)
MAKTMTQANSIPHFGYDDEIVADRIMALRRDLKKIAEARGIKLSLMPMLIKAVSLALKQFPTLNASYDEPKNSMIIKGSHNIGIAMDTPNGLVVPSIQ